MKLNTFMLVLSGVLLNAVAQLFLKSGTNALGNLTLAGAEIFRTGLRIGTNPSIILGLGCYVVSVGVWIVALSKTEVSIAYPMLSIGYVVNLFAAYYLFGESISLQKIIGIGLIIIGVLLLTKA